MNLQLTRPVRSKRITQQFGENKACLTRDGKVVAALKDGVCPANTIPFYQNIGMRGHNGLDIATFHGEVCVNPFVDRDCVMYTHVDNAGGVGVDLVTVNKIDGSHWKVRLWHLLTPIGYDGKVVEYGEVCGLCDNTGNSSGSHLHFGLKRCDAKGNAFNKDNGYYGAVDQAPYYNHEIFAGDSVQYLGGATPLTVENKKQLSEYLGVMRRMLFALRELISKL